LQFVLSIGQRRDAAFYIAPIGRLQASRNTNLERCTIKLADLIA